MPSAKRNYVLFPANETQYQLQINHASRSGQRRNGIETNESGRLKARREASVLLVRGTNLLSVSATTQKVNYIRD